MARQLIYLWLLLPCLTWTGCKTGAECLEEMKFTFSVLENSFEDADSLAFTKRIPEVAQLSECVENSEDLIITQKAEADAMTNAINAMYQGLSCRCYENRLNTVFEAMDEAKDLDLETWRILYARWEKTIKTAGGSDLDYYLSKCSNSDLQSITAMRSTVAAWNGYQEADAIINNVESTLQEIISTGEGIFNRLMEKADQAPE